MRLIFIPGLGEEAFIFEKIHPLLAGDKLFIDNWALVGEHPRPELTALVYARELAQRFAIDADDVVIGHSMGGWIALHLKQLTGCRVVQIASWSDPGRVVRPIRSRRMAYWLVKRGIYFSGLVLRVLRWKRYRNQPSAPVFSRVFRRLCSGPGEAAINQLRIILNPVTEPLTALPDLRIHARADRLVRCPNDPFCEVAGDHFSIYTHPEQVYEPIAAMLQQQPAALQGTALPH